MIAAGKQCDIAGPCASNPCNSTNTNRCEQDPDVFTSSDSNVINNFTCVCLEGGSLRAGSVGRHLWPSQGCTTRSVIGCGSLLVCSLVVAACLSVLIGCGSLSVCVDWLCQPFCLSCLVGSAFLSVLIGCVGLSVCIVWLGQPFCLC